VSTDFTYVRRVARAALEHALDMAGIPADYVVLPHQDDHERLIVVSEQEVRWVDDRQSYRRAEIWFTDTYIGRVHIPSTHRLTNSRDFNPEDYGLAKAAHLPFDITDIAERHEAGWQHLPKAALRQRPVMKRYTMRTSL
jgi:hypothetical protein